MEKKKLGIKKVKLTTAQMAIQSVERGGDAGCQDRSCDAYCVEGVYWIPFKGFIIVRC